MTGALASSAPVFPAGPFFPPCRPWASPARGCLPHRRRARSASRPPVAQDRLSLTGDGQVRLELKRPWSDGTTHLLFDPVELLERLAVLTPRPRINLILYHGVLAPRAAWRSLVVGHVEAAGPGDGGTDGVPDPCESSHCPRGLGSARWAELMRRSFGFDVLACPRCGGRLRLIALVEEASVIERDPGRRRSRHHRDRRPLRDRPRAIATPPAAPARRDTGSG